MPKTIVTNEPRKNRSPSSNDWAEACGAPETGGDGRRRANATSASTKVPASTKYAVLTPKAPIRIPASAGPAIMPKDPYVDCSVNAAGRSSTSSSNGSRERTTGVVDPNTAAVAAPRTNTTHSCGWSRVALTARPPEQQIATEVTTSNILRLSKLSAKAPPRMAKNSRGPSWAKPRRPTSSEE